MRPYFLLSLSLFACTGDKSEETAQQCDPPVAEAGSDISIGLGETVTLDATSSTWCEQRADSLTAHWEFIRTPADSAVTNAVLSDNDSKTAVSAQFLPDEIGDYVLALTLNDGENSSVEDHVVISVQVGDLAPTADCGGSYTGDIGQVVSLNGASSFDPEAAELEYSWSLLAPSCSGLNDDSISNQSAANAAFVPDCDGVYITTLVVSDGNQWSQPAICSVDVASSNRLPIADAGEDQHFGGCAPDNIPLDGYGSYDLDGDALSYQWTLLSAPNESTVTSDSISDRSMANPHFAWDLIGQYQFQLQVSDGNMWSAPDLVNINIDNITSNDPPIANAGEDQELETRASCQDTSSYVSNSSTCLDCPRMDFVLDATGTIDPNGDTLTYSWTETTGELTANNGLLHEPNLAITEVSLPTRAANTGTTTMSFMLQVSDCAETDSKTVNITYACIGN